MAYCEWIKMKIEAWKRKYLQLNAQTDFYYEILVFINPLMKIQLNIYN